MNGNNHFIYAMSVTGAVALNMATVHNYLPNIPLEHYMGACLVMGGVIGGIFPDIDNPKSHFGQLSKPISTIIGKVNFKIGKTGSQHRGIFHDGSVYLMGLVLSYLYAPYLLGFFLGALSHLFLDAFNPMGIPILFGVKHIHLGKIRSDSLTARVLTWILILTTWTIGFFLKFYWFK